ncbi:MAG: SMP-30/gluconolactonase/LRE family protein [Acidobacteria bacterium]|nr:SMP-30/gluconolactonase/LRE family protein [Acidobacteriota bacterium]
MKRTLLAALAGLVLALGATVELKPAAEIDLTTKQGVAAVKGQWRYSDARITDTEFRGKTYDIAPRGGALEFDDSGWEAIEPGSLPEKRGNGRLSFNWYRIRVTVPESVGGFSTAGSTAMFEISVDDYAEVWVDGELTRAAGQKGGSVVAGWNAPNQLVVGRNVRPGQQIQLAIFGINGPISNPPTNFIFVRLAKLSFHRAAPGPVAIQPAEVNVDVTRKDPRIDAIISRNPKIYKLAEGFQFTEGPVWVPGSPGHLLFSDPNANTIYKYVPGPDNQAGELSVFRNPSGYSGADIGEYRQPGSNGLALDPQGRLTINEHGNRRVSRLERDGSVTVLADRFEGKRLNSPNDLVYRSDGALFFTDPPFGLPKFGEDPRKETPFNGIYSFVDGRLRLLSKELSGPNGIAFSPDEKFLYVGNWDDNRKVVLRYPVNPDGTAGEGKLFIDMTSTAGEDAIDGIKVDRAGNVYVSGPGGLWIVAPDGTHLGTVIAPKHPHNFAWAEDGKSLYLCARSGLYRLKP